jgi:membrane-bound lytic murein transglycosylase B
MAFTELADIDDLPPRRTLREILPLLGSILGAFGLVGVLVGVMSIGAVQRSSPAFIVPSAEAVVIAADDSVADQSAPAATNSARPANDTAAVANSPTRRVDPAWAARTAAATGIPVRAVLAYGSATLTLGTQQPGCHIAWNTLAGIGAV